MTKIIIAPEKNQIKNMEEILNKIKELSRAKGYTLENMANELNFGKHLS